MQFQSPPRKYGEGFFIWYIWSTYCETKNSINKKISNIYQFHLLYIYYLYYKKQPTILYFIFNYRINLFCFLEKFLYIKSLYVLKSKFNIFWHISLLSTIFT